MHVACRRSKMTYVSSTTKPPSDASSRECQVFKLFQCAYVFVSCEQLRMEQVEGRASFLSFPQKKSSESFAIIVDAGNKTFSAPGNAILLDSLQNSNFTRTKIQKRTFFQKSLFWRLSVQTGRKCIFGDFR